ncbi:hypothetical protein AB0B50_43990 [Streptomyces sp. NPDC041068]|uniref:hypothetical protein n=1 Tax=Streptomyces sp. NPDC041068 TaxID=3155130 RepID=UPI0033CD599E
MTTRYQTEQGRRPAKIKPKIAVTTAMMALAAVAMTAPMASAGAAQAQQAPKATRAAAAPNTPAQGTAAPCHVPGYGGNYLCQYPPKYYVYPNGTKAVYVIGTDRAVWERMRTASGHYTPWKSLHGKAYSKVFVHRDTGYNVTLKVKDSIGRWWYASRIPSTGNFTNWHL